MLLPIEPYSSAGGAVATVTRHVTRAWAADGIDVTVIAPGGNEAPYPEGRSIPLSFGRNHPMSAVTYKAWAALARIRHWDWPDFGPYRRVVRQAVLSIRPTPDLIIAHNDLQLLPLLRQAAPEARIVLWLHNEVQTAHRTPDALLRLADVIIAVSHYIADWTERHYHLPAGRVTVVPNGVDLDRFHPRPESVVSPDPVGIVCHGRIDPAKGFHLARDAVAQLQREGHNVSFTLAGGKTAFGISTEAAQHYQDELIDSLESLGGQYLGRLDPDEVPAVLRSHDIGCAPSIWPEPFSLSALEAMASGCAIVAIKSGGLPEVCGESGILIDPSRPETLLDALRSLVIQTELLQERKRAARMRSEQMPWSSTASGVLSAATAAGQPS